MLFGIYLLMDYLHYITYHKNSAFLLFIPLLPQLIKDLSFGIRKLHQIHFVFLLIINIMPRRIPDFPDSFYSWNLLSSVGSGVTLLSLVVFLVFVFLISCLVTSSSINFVFYLNFCFSFILQRNLFESVC